jgi:putative addiction module component (TIGR02574 family)
MSDRENVLQQALALSAEDRAYVVTVLQTSLATPEAVERDPAADRALLTELQRRSEAYRSGSTTARAAAEVMAEQRKRQSREATT